MKYYTYTMTHDTGFAPNPFHGYCTLATCKGPLRRAVANAWLAGERDLFIMGVGGTTLEAKARNGADGRIIYIMEVTEVLDFAGYYNDSRFEKKKATANNDKLADNIYKPIKTADHIEYRCTIPCGAHLNEDDQEGDLRGLYVLISGRGKSFYFGKDGFNIKGFDDRDYQRFLKKGPSYKELISNGIPLKDINALIDYAEKKYQERGAKIGSPHGC